MAERAIQTIRRQALTLLKGTEENAGILIAHTHPVFSWAFRHASWILNRYRYDPLWVDFRRLLFFQTPEHLFPSHMPF